MNEKKLTINDSPMFERVMADPEICKGVIRAVLGITVDKIEYRNTEQHLDSRLGSKGVRLDAFVKADGKVYDIEIQNYRQVSIGKRFRYYQSAIDTSILREGMDYDQLPESYVIFLCTFDPFNAELPIYHFERQCIEGSNIDLGCASHWVVLNSADYSKAEGLLFNLLQYMANGVVSEKDSLTKAIDSAVRTANRDREWVEKTMSFMSLEENVAMQIRLNRREALAEGREIGIKEGREAGIQQGIEQGIEQEEARFKALVKHLAADDRLGELSRISEDETLLEDLCRQYGL